MSAGLRQKIQHIARDLQPEMLEIRRHLHRYPELSFKEYKTSEYIRAQLDRIGIPWKKVADTGTLAWLDGNTDGRVIALRADIDALPIREMNQASYASVHEGVMHACGHDFHTTSLLGCIRIIQQLHDDLSGTIKFFFQPGEEVIPGGASLLIREGVLEDPKVDAVIGQHAMPRLEAGTVGFRKGKFMASMDSLFVTVRGKGGHGAQPHLNTDPVLIASHIIVALQQVVSRMAPPAEPTVLSFGRVVADGAINVIPDSVYMEGTFRAMNERWRDDAHKRMVALATRVADAMGGSCDFRIQRGYPFLVNEDKLTSAAQRLARDYLGVDKVVEEDIWMAAEDFAYYSQVRDSCFFLTGVGNAAKNVLSSLHTPTFDIDESALETGMGLFAYLGIKLAREQDR